MSTTFECNFNAPHAQGRTAFAVMKWLAFAAVLLALPLHAAVYYVDSATGSDANSGTSTSAPWAHLPGAVGYSGSGWATVRSGDTVYVKGGSVNYYQVVLGSPRYSSTASYDSIQIKSGDAIGWGTGRAIFDQQKSRTYGFAFGPGSSGVTLNRLEIREIGQSASAIYGNGSACIEMGNASSQVTYIRIKDCYLHHAYGSANDIGHGVEWYANGMQSASYVIIEGCRIENIRTKGIEVYGHHNIIRNNYIQKTGDHGIVLTSNNCDVYNNIINMCGVDAGVAETAPFVHNPVFALKINYSYNDVFNNLAFNSTGANGSQGFGSHGSNNRFIHNTVGYFRQSNWADNGANAFNIGFEQGSNIVDYNELRSNIGAFCSPSSGQGQVFIWDAAKGAVIDRNNFYSSAGTLATVYGRSGAYNQWSVATLDSTTLANGIDARNNQSSNPQFAGGTMPTGLNTSFQPNTGYFALGASTPAAISATGNDLTSLPANGAQPSSKFGYDILGNRRSSWSMGAYEFSTSTTSRPLAPTSLRVVSGS